MVMMAIAATALVGTHCWAWQRRSNPTASIRSRGRSFEQHKGLAISQLSGMSESLTGRGVRATVDGRIVSVGGPGLLRELGVDDPGRTGSRRWRPGARRVRRCST